MAQGDRYRVTITVVEDGGVTCMGDTSYWDEKTGTYMFDKYSFESIERLPDLPDLPEEIGDRIKVTVRSDDGTILDFIAMRTSYSNRWVTTWFGKDLSITSDEIAKMEWEPLP